MRKPLLSEDAIQVGFSEINTCHEFLSDGVNWPSFWLSVSYTVKQFKSSENENEPKMDGKKHPILTVSSASFGGMF